MLKYPKFVADLDFIAVSTISLDIWSGIKVDFDMDTEDVTYVVVAVESFSRSINLDNFRLHTENELLILDDLKLSKISVDKVIQFGLRPPELCELIDEFGHYYCWFVVCGKIK